LLRCVGVRAGDRRGIPHCVRNDVDGLALISLKKNDKPIRRRVLCIGALTAPNTKENYVNNLSELLNYFNELLEQTWECQGAHYKRGEAM
jgi:hypothetical protein